MPDAQKKCAYPAVAKDYTLHIEGKFNNIPILALTDTGAAGNLIGRSLLAKARELGRVELQPLENIRVTGAKKGATLEILGTLTGTLNLGGKDIPI